MLSILVFLAPRFFFFCFRLFLVVSAVKAGAMKANTYRRPIPLGPLPALRAANPRASLIFQLFSLVTIGAYIREKWHKTIITVFQMAKLRF